MRCVAVGMRAVVGAKSGDDDVAIGRDGRLTQRRAFLCTLAESVGEPDAPEHAGVSGWKEQLVEVCVFGQTRSGLNSLILHRKRTAGTEQSRMRQKPEPGNRCVAVICRVLPTTAWKGCC